MDGVATSNAQRADCRLSVQAPGCQVWSVGVVGREGPGPSAGTLIGESSAGGGGLSSALGAAERAERAALGRRRVGAFAGGLLRGGRPCLSRSATAVRRVGD